MPPMVRFKRRHRPHHTTNRLRVFRASRRWSQTDVALRMGFESRYRYWQIENEEIEPTARERAKLAKLFRCRDVDIFPRLEPVAS